MHETTVLMNMDNLCLNYKNLDVSSNLFLGQELLNRHHPCDDGVTRRRSHQVLQPLSSPICVGQLTAPLSSGQKQTVSTTRTRAIMNKGIPECS